MYSSGSKQWTSALEFKTTLDPWQADKTWLLVSEHSWNQLKQPGITAPLSGFEKAQKQEIILNV